MAAEAYDYQLIGGTFPNDRVDIPSLVKEIQTSSEITIALNGTPVVTVISDVAHVTVPFKDSLTSQSPNQKPFLDSVIAGHQGDPTSLLPKVDLDTQKSPDGLLLISPTKSFQIPSHTVVSIDYSDTMTWWYGSTRVTGEGPGTSDDTVFTLSGSPELVNIYKLTAGEESRTGYDPNDYRVVVYRNGVNITYDTETGVLKDEYGFEGGSTAAGKTYPYQVNYSSGTITFDAAQTGQSITVDYSKPASHGKFRLVSPPGKKLCLEHVELQFTSDHPTWPCPMQFVPILNGPEVGGVDYEGAPSTYRGMYDILNIFNLGTGVPAGGGFAQGLYQIPMDYISGYTIYPTGENTSFASNTVNALELRMKYDGISLDSSMEIATCSFYCLERDL